MPSPPDSPNARAASSSAALPAGPSAPGDEAVFAESFEMAAVGMAHVALDGRFVRVNRRLCAMVGYTREELLARTFQEITHKDDLAPDLDLVDRLLAGHVETYNLEKRYLHQNGAVVWINLSVSLLKKADGRPHYFLSVIEDITSRKRAEDALREAEEALRRERDTIQRILESSPLGMTLVDRDGRMVVANAQAEQILRLRREPAGSGFYVASASRAVDYAGNTLPPSELPFQQVQRSSTAVRDIRYGIDFGDGRPTLLSVNAAPLTGPLGFDGMVATFEDVTGRPEAERLAAADRRRATILESISDAFVALDRDWRYTYVNRRAAEIFGRDPDELVGKHIWTEFPDSVGLPIYHLHHKAMADGIPVQIEQYYPPLDRWYDNRIYAAENGLVTYFTDITERKRAEAHLRESEERFRQIAEHIDEVFWMTDPAKREMLYVSPAYEVIWGRPRESLYADPREWLEAVHPEDRARLAEAMRTRQADGRYDEQYRIVRPDGALRWIRDRAFPVRNPAGELYRIVGVAQDVTVQNDTEEALRHSEEKFAKAFQASPDALLLTRLVDGALVEVNEVFLKMSGYSRERALGSTSLDLGVWVDPEARSRYLATLEKPFTGLQLATAVRRALDRKQNPPAGDAPGV